jgi:hypothetical protein
MLGGEDPAGTKWRVAKALGIIRVGCGILKQTGSSARMRWKFWESRGSCRGIQKRHHFRSVLQVLDKLDKRFSRLIEPLPRKIPRHEIMVVSAA